MGRQQHLERMALGRSAFQDLEDDDHPNVGQGNPAGDEQQYDSKGRPTNPATEATNTQLRHAQNVILEVVGVVERIDKINRREDSKYQLKREAQRRLLVFENALGQMIELLTVPTGFFTHLWTGAFVQRMQIGFYDPGKPMLEILAAEGRLLLGSETTITKLAILFPALGDLVVHFVVKLPLMLTIEQLAGRIQTFMARKVPRRSTARRLHHVTTFLCEALWMAVDMTVLPMNFHASAQRLGLAPLLPLFPTVRTFWPWSPVSFHQVGWKPIVSMYAVRTLTSPAFLMLFMRIVRRDAFDAFEDSDYASHTPIFTALTSFRNPAIDDCASGVLSPHLRNDPFGWILHKCYCIRATFLAALGWSMENVRGLLPDEDKFESNVMHRPATSSEGDEDWSTSAHRATVLAQLPAKYLAMRVDHWIARLLMLPLESLMLRSIASSFMLSPSTTKTARALEAAHRLYEPFGGGPVGALVSSSGSPVAWHQLSIYASRVGLAMALDCGIDVLRFGFLYSTVRFIGVRSYDWAKCDV